MSAATNTAIIDDNFNDLFERPYSKVPAGLKELNQWNVHRGKTPFDPRTGKPANDINLGVSFEEACKVAREGRYDGIGIYIGRGLGAVDFDDCIDESGVVSKEVAEAIRANPGFIWEVSPSGKGIHGYGFGTKPGRTCRKGRGEIYDSARYLRISGNLLDESSRALNMVDFTDLYNRISRGDFVSESLTGPSEPKTASPIISQNVLVHHHGPLTDLRTLLMTGECVADAKPFVVSDGGGCNSIEYFSQSEAIAALLLCLAEKHNCDPGKIENDFLNSTLYKGIPKWNGPSGKWARLGKSEVANAIKKVEANRASASSLAAPTTSVDTFVVNWRKQFCSVSELAEGGVRMLIDGFLPEGTSFLGALSSTGKTFFGLSICKALTTGRPFLGKFPVPKIVSVLYMIPESSGSAFRKRCEKFGIPSDPKLFLCRTISQGAPLALNDPALLAAVAEMKPVVFLDTSIRFSRSTDEDSATANKIFVNEVLALLAAGAVGVVCVHHATKASRKEGLTLESCLRGSGDLGAMADCVYGLQRNDVLYNNGAGPNEIQVICFKPRDFEAPQPFTIAATAKVDDQIISHIDTKGDFVLLEKGDLIADEDSRFVNAVTTEPDLSFGELAEKLGLQKYQVQRIAKRLRFVKHKEGWQLSSLRIGTSTDPKASDDVEEEQNVGNR